jgi:hypothetical protein
MGLDMYLRGDKFISKYDMAQRDERGYPLEVKRPVIDGFEVTSYSLDLGYWRKFAPLHKFIVNVFADGVDECQEIHLSASELRSIANALRDGGLPNNEDCNGFFFGSSEMWDEDRADAHNHAETFDKAADWVDGNSWNSVIYQASW